jgi:hypothetical protein
VRTKLAAGIMAISAVLISGGAGIAVAASAPGSGRPEHLRIMSTKATSGRLSVIATGVFTAGGYDIPARVTDTVVVPGGTLKFRHFTRSETASFDPRTCLGTETQEGRFTIGHGTGRYARIHGTGKFVTSIIFVTSRDRAGQCTHAQAPATFQQITTASGTVTR